MREAAPKVVLTIAGFDPSSGAGITADLKTIAAHGLYGVACITALTVQTTYEVQRSEPVRPELVAGTLDALVDDTPPDALKIGMLGSNEVAATVAKFLRAHPLPNVVLDPVLRSSSGATLLDEAGVGVLKDDLIGLADVITPNLDEAARLAGFPVNDLSSMQQACQRLKTLGAKNVVITGGHLNDPTDMLALDSPDGLMFYTFQNGRVETKSTHGTGCAHSTAIACNLAIGLPLEGSGGAVSRSGIYVVRALQQAYVIGKGTGSINHFHGANFNS